MNWRGIKRRLKRNPALLDMNYRALPGTAEAMARSMRAFSEMAETVRLRASLTEERRNMLAHAINPEPRSHRRRACAMLSCALAVILLLATAVSGVFLPQEDVWIVSRLAACQQNDEESVSVRWHMRTGGGSVRCGWPWQDTARAGDPNHSLRFRPGRTELAFPVCSGGLHLVNRGRNLTAYPERAARLSLV